MIKSGYLSLFLKSVKCAADYVQFNDVITYILNKSDTFGFN